MQYEIEILVSEKRIYRVEANDVDEVIRLYDGVDDAKSPLLDNPTRVFDAEVDLVAVNDMAGKTHWVNDVLSPESLIAATLGM